MLRRVARVTGTGLMAVGLAILVFVSYELFWTGRATERAQHQLEQELQREPPPPRSGYPPKVRPPTLGHAVAAIRIPRLGKNWRYVVVQGTDAKNLEKGPGHIVGTTLPGQPGNVAISGHRVTYAHPFYDLDKLHAGDRIYLTTSYGRFTYTVTWSRVVTPTDVAVIAPQPGKRLLTLTTCNPRYSARQRLVVRAVLVDRLAGNQRLNRGRG